MFIQLFSSENKKLGSATSFRPFTAGAPQPVGCRTHFFSIFSFSPSFFWFFHWIFQQVMRFSSPGSNSRGHWGSNVDFNTTKKSWPASSGYQDQKDVVATSYSMNFSEINKKIIKKRSPSRPLVCNNGSICLLTSSVDAAASSQQDLAQSSSNSIQLT